MIWNIISPKLFTLCLQRKTKIWPPTNLFLNFTIPNTFTMWHKILAWVYFYILEIFLCFEELVFAIRTDWFYLLGINFCNFQKVPDKSMIIFSFFIEYVQWKYIFIYNSMVCKPYVKPAKHCHLITITSVVTDCSNDQSEVISLSKWKKPLP